MDFTHRTRLLIKDKGMEQLKKSTVLVVGCGAVGGMCLECLARSGVGRVIIVDFDVFSISNINRQLFATHDTIGKLKTDIAYDRLKSINPNIEIEIINTALNESNIDTILSRPIDFAVDAIDSLASKICLIENLIDKNIPFISAMGAALKKDITKIKITPLSQTIQCPLAKFVRKRLHKMGVSMDFPVVFSSECVSDKSGLGEKQADMLCMRGRHELGSIITITAQFGLLCAHYAIFHLIEK